jgi:endonuclease/exonuclease/phosphatase family metal-dependent hydrolase
MNVELTLFSKIQKTRRRGLLQCFNLSLVVSLGIFMTACSSMPPEKPLQQHSRNSHSVRVGTYNVFTGAHDTARTVKAIRRMNADVLLLQELSPQGAKSLDHALKIDFRYRHFSKGVAILSRYPLRNQRYEQSQHGINGFLFAEVHSPSGKFQVASLHLDPLRIWTTREKWSLPMQLMGGQDDVHRREVRQIVKALRPGMPSILGGDFNSVSGVPIREFQKLGYTDSFAKVNQHPNQTHTLHFKLFGFPTGRRIDYLLHDSSLQTMQSQVFPGAPSDHDGVVSVLSWK